MIEINEYRYAKGKVAAIVLNVGEVQWKSEEHSMLEALGGKWTHRAGGYVITRKSAERAIRLLQEGWTTEFGLKGRHILVPPKRACA